FVPFALHDHDAYTAKVQARFAREGVAVTALGADAREGARVDGAEAVFVGGGNTFRLLDTLQRTGLLAALRRKARSGAPYLGRRVAAGGGKATAARGLPRRAPFPPRPRSGRGAPGSGARRAAQGNFWLYVWRTLTRTPSFTAGS